MPRRELNGAESTSLEVLASRRAHGIGVQKQIEQQIEKLTQQIDDLVEKSKEEAAKCEVDILRLLGYLNDGEGEEIPPAVVMDLDSHLSGERGAMVLTWESPKPEPKEPEEADADAPAFTETVTTDTETVRETELAESSA